MAQLLLLVKLRGVEIWRGCPLVRIHGEDDRVVGVVVKREGVEMLVRAKRIVILCAGGFAMNVAMRREHMQGPVSDKWTAAPDGDM